LEMIGMPLITWSDEYLTGFSDVDEQQRALFELINSFIKDNDGAASNKALLAFLNELLFIANNHLKLEERYMKKSGYPLLNYHKNSHKNLWSTAYNLRRQVKRRKLNEPYSTVVDFSTEWFNNHIARDDLTYIRFCQSLDQDLGKGFVGRKCRILTMGNLFLYNGTIKTVDKRRVVISLVKDKNTTVRAGEDVKVSSVSDEDGKQVFGATIYHCSPRTLKLLNATVMQDEDKRGSFRVSIEIDASLRFNEVSHPIKIIDMSSSGMRVESDQIFTTDDLVTISFDIELKRMLILCKVVRVSVNKDSSNSYGLQFHHLINVGSESINTFLYSKQLSERV